MRQSIEALLSLHLKFYGCSRFSKISHQLYHPCDSLWQSKHYSSPSQSCSTLSHKTYETWYLICSWESSQPFLTCYLYPCYWSNCIPPHQTTISKWLLFSPWQTQCYWMFSITLSLSGFVKSIRGMSLFCLLCFSLSLLCFTYLLYFCYGIMFSVNGRVAYIMCVTHLGIFI